MTDMQKAAEGPLSDTSRFNRARNKLEGIPRSEYAAFIDGYATMSLEAYEALADEVVRLRRALRDTPAAQEMLAEIQEALDFSFDKPTGIRLVQGGFVTDIGHAVLDAIEAKTGVLP